MDANLQDCELPSIVAHSFGSYILGNALLKYDTIRFDKVILCGSILPQQFPWDKIIERGQVQVVRNEYGVKDPWVRMVRHFVRGTGPSGAVGFSVRHERLVEEEFLFDHSEYFDPDHIKDRWLRFLNQDVYRLDRQAASIEPPKSKQPMGLYGIGVILTILLIYLGTVCCSKRSPEPLSVRWDLLHDSSGEPLLVTWEEALEAALERGGQLPTVKQAKELLARSTTKFDSEPLMLFPPGSDAIALPKLTHYWTNERSPENPDKIDVIEFYERGGGKVGGNYVLVHDNEGRPTEYAVQYVLAVFSRRTQRE